MAKKRLTHIDRYEIVKQLGEGGMGVVYHCYDPDLQRHVAIKVIRDDLNPNTTAAVFTAESELRGRFMREALATCQLQHPGIPPVYEVRQQATGRIYYVMKSIEGVSLHEVLTKLRARDEKKVREFDIDRLVSILMSICQTVMYAHSQGFIHRDLKPANIFVGDYGEVYVMDWGLTKALEKELPASDDLPTPKTPSFEQNTDISDESNKQMHSATTVVCDDMTDTKNLDGAVPEEAEVLTMPGRMLGTLYYMAPEQAKAGWKDVNKPSDIYALGVILYEMLTLQLPITGKTAVEVMNRKLDSDFKPPEMLAPERSVPSELSAIAVKAMQGKIDERFTSVKEFYNALVVWKEGKSQFFTVSSLLGDQQSVRVLPKDTKRNWVLSERRVETASAMDRQHSYLLFGHETPGDVRFSTYITAFPLNEEGEISEFAVLLNAAIPRQYRGFLDCYSIHIGASGNTRAYLARNDTEITSNEYVVLEPGTRYRLTVERTNGEIRVLINGQVILFFRDTNPLDGSYTGLWHLGSGVAFSDFSLQTRSHPTKTDVIEIPEALMEEACYEAAEYHFLRIAKSHKNRVEGAWARYRAGIASFMRTGRRTEPNQIWRPLRSTPYAVFELLGRVVLDLRQKRPQQAATKLLEILDGDNPIPYLEPIADIALSEAQERLRVAPTSRKSWKNTDLWVKAALKAAGQLPGKADLIPSILWRWFYISLTKFPDHLTECVAFMREVFSCKKGGFSELLTAIEPLIRILRRSADMSDHVYLMTKVMRLVLNYEDRLGSLEILFRFYLHAGQDQMARRLAMHICGFCDEHCYAPPCGPLVFLACDKWIKEEPEREYWYEKLIAESVEWGRIDGLLLKGLEHWRKGQHDVARNYWEKVKKETLATAHNRQLIADGLLDCLPLDPVKAGVPNRAGHRLLYCMFLGYRYYSDWSLSYDEDVRKDAVALLLKAHSYLRPSYDIYSAAEHLILWPLSQMGEDIQSRRYVEPVSDEEKAWVDQLTQAASVEESQQTRADT